MLQRAQPQLGKVAAILSGLALPLAIERIILSSELLFGGTLIGALVGAVVLTLVQGRAEGSHHGRVEELLQGRVEGWKISVGMLSVFVLYSVLR
jgi:hypothetical protein